MPHRYFTTEIADGDIFPRPGEVCQRERPWQRDEVCVDCQGLSPWEIWRVSD